MPRGQTEVKLAMWLRIVWFAVQYFAMVFAAGVLLALIRIPFLVPRLGVRMAELIECL